MPDENDQKIRDFLRSLVDCSMHYLALSLAFGVTGIAYRTPDENFNVPAAAILSFLLYLIFWFAYRHFVKRSPGESHG